MSNVFQLNLPEYELGIRDAQACTDSRSMSAMFVTATRNVDDSYWIGVADELRPRIHPVQFDDVRESQIERLEIGDTDRDDCRAAFEDDDWMALEPSDDELNELGD